MTLAVLIGVVSFGVDSTAAAGSDAGPTEPGSDSRERVEIQFHITQSVSIGLGLFSGNRDAYAKYENKAVPSLNPDIELEGRAGLRLQSADDWRLRLDVTWAGEGATVFGIGWRQWDLESGPHSFDFGRAGFDYVRSGRGLRLRRFDGDGGLGLDVAALRSTTRRMEVVVPGDDSFGPFPLGKKRLLPESETVWHGGKRLQRGRGAGDGDYFIDYDGGFLYLHRVLLAHETVRVTYEYEVNGGSSADEFFGASASYRWDRTDLHAFGMRESTPGPGDGGELLHAYGVRLETTTARGARWTSDVSFTNLSAAGGVPVPLGARATNGGYSPTAALVLANPFGPPESNVPTWSAGDASVYGLRTAHRIEYTGRRWHTTTSVQWSEPGFVDPSTRRLDPNLWSVETNNRYALRDGWALLLRGTVSERRASPEQGTPSEAGPTPEHGTLSERGISERGTSLKPGLPSEPGPTSERGTPFEPGPTPERRTSLGRKAMAGRVVPEKFTTTSVASVGIEYVRRLFQVRLLLGQHQEFERDWTAAPSQAEAANAPRFAGSQVPPRFIQARFLQGELRWQTDFGALDVDFQQRLEAYRGGLPERLQVSASTGVFRWPVSLSYTRGEQPFKENVEVRVAAPLQRAHARGVFALATRWLYEEGLDDRPLVVHTLTGDFAYDLPSGAYIHGRGSGALIDASLTGASGGQHNGSRTVVYDGMLNVGRPLGEGGLIDYSLRMSGREVVLGVGGPPRLVASNTAHAVTVAGTLPGQIGATLLWRWSEGRRSLPGPPSSADAASVGGALGGSTGADPAVLNGGSGSSDSRRALTTEQGWDVSLRRAFGPVGVTLSYSYSAAETAGTRTSVEQTGLGFLWERGLLSLQGNVRFELHDGWRRRSMVEFVPTYDVSDGVRLWIVYEFTTSDQPVGSADRLVESTRWRDGVAAGVGDGVGNGAADATVGSAPGISQAVVGGAVNRAVEGAPGVGAGGGTMRGGAEGGDGATVRGAAEGVGAGGGVEGGVEGGGVGGGVGGGGRLAAGHGLRSVVAIPSASESGYTVHTIRIGLTVRF